MLIVDYNNYISVNLETLLREIWYRTQDSISTEEPDRKMQCEERSNQRLQFLRRFLFTHSRFFYTKCGNESAVHEKY